MPLVEAELRRLARGYMARERRGHTLQTTALVNEAFVRLTDARRVRWQDRAHFLGISARLMRRVLVDHARRRGFQKTRWRRTAGESARRARHIAGPGIRRSGTGSRIRSIGQSRRSKEQDRGATVLRRLERRGNGRGAPGFPGHGQTRLATGETLVASRARRRRAVTDPERQRRVEDLCDAALDRDARERVAFVAAACGDDDALRQEVESLLAHARRPRAFSRHRWRSWPPGSWLMSQGEWLVGRQIGPHKILSLSRRRGDGRGLSCPGHEAGPGCRHQGRVGPLPFSPRGHGPLRTRGPGARDAEPSAHRRDLWWEETDGVRGLVLELVEGATLAERLALGPLSIQEALTVARQIADALEAAHEKSIIHRDLKPANIKITPKAR